MDVGETQEDEHPADVPDWALEPGEQFRGYATDTHHLFLVAGLALSLIADYGPDQLERVSLDAEQVAGVVAFAIQEQQRGHRRLGYHALVDVWSALERLVDDVVLAFITHDNTVLTEPPLAKVQLTLGQVASLDRQALAGEIFARLADVTRIALKPGVGQFLPVLGAVGLTLRADRTLRRDILAMQQLRHVIVHRAGIVDQRLVDRCSWLDFKVGEPITLEMDQVLGFIESAMTFEMELSFAIARRFGASEALVERLRRGSAAGQEPDEGEDEGPSTLG